MAFSPVIASEHITEKYMRYLNTIFSVDNEGYNKQLQALLKAKTTFAAGPYLDVTDSFEKGKSIEELVKEGILAESFCRIRIPLTRPLYKHQEIAIRKISAGNNLIVSTGTGSGKTESFLIPVLNHIIREYESGVLHSGVRALLIYPMNALANDQIERLRELLADFPEITFGCYTGQTKEKYTAALADYKELNDQREPLPNEFISREQMKAAPPHILVTNYAMLEYLMLRPGDTSLFNGGHWKFIVLDEAHVYKGGSGIEVAMLLRRLKARVSSKDLQYILTSATLGDENSNKEVAEFGQNLCNSEFATDNIVRAYRILPRSSNETKQLSFDFYRDLAALFDRGTEDNDLLSYIDRIDAGNTGTVSERLFDIILQDENYLRIKAAMDTAKTLKELSVITGYSEEALCDFVTVASKAEKNQVKLFDARYHMFIRATESAFITLEPSNKLFLTRKKVHLEPDGKDYKVFEIATCSVCHAIYLIGTIKEDHLEQASVLDEDNLRSVFLLKKEVNDTDEDHSLEADNIETEEYEICTRCGYLKKTSVKSGKLCEHGKESFVKIHRVRTLNENGTITKCPACENRNATGILRMLFTGQEAVTSVLGTALFEELPSYYLKQVKTDVDDDFGFGDEGDSKEETIRIPSAKQFISFSDSRQAAAFFATYFDQTYRNMLYKRVITEAIMHREPGVAVGFNTIVDEVEDIFLKENIVDGGTDQRRKEAWKALLHEMADNNGNTSLLNTGLLTFEFENSFFTANTKLGMSQDDVAKLCSVFALGMMADAAIHYGIILNSIDREFIAHNGVEYSYTLSDPDQKKYRLSFIPRFADKTNKRADYLQRVLSSKGIHMENEKVNKALEAIWNYIFVGKGLLEEEKGEYKIDSSKVCIKRPKEWYVCTKCRRITPFNLESVCPGYKCTGTLQKIDINEYMKGNHYFESYQKMDIRKMRVVEHTAQLNRETAYEFQKMFKKKEIDVLSCSTTFEMGVDVGSLETVFMRNMPPSPANYAQRAGRAGRSRESAAYALTFCNKANHDFSFFSNPVQMIKGRIEPPKFSIDNEKIAIRHIYASALAFFWRENPRYFSTASKMMEGLTDDPDGETGLEKFKEYLKGEPVELKEYLLAFLPKRLADKFDVEHFGWVSGLLGDNGDNPGVLVKAQNEYEYEVGVLNDALNELIEKRSKGVDWLQSRIKVYQNEELLSFLSRKNVLPKYGFPVDTVELEVHNKESSSKVGLQLQRDLEMAISEYAPGSQIVANGRLITSQYIKKVPKMSWKMYDYIKCECSSLNIEPHIDTVDNPHLTECKRCGKPFESSKKKTFLIPEFGFIADGDKVKSPGLKRPVRTYRGEVSYVGKSKNAEVRRITTGSALIEMISSKGDEMAVINDSGFYVCEECGYTDLDEKQFVKIKKKQHKRSSGADCRAEGHNTLKRYSLGYRFETDVVQVRFIQPDLTNMDDAISILYGMIRGICAVLDIESGDVSGCVQYYNNEQTGRMNYSLVFYDKTPGGAGHVRRLIQDGVMEMVLKKTMEIMKKCTCGGENGDSSCYACLRDYYNQKYHDTLNRGTVIRFLKKLGIE